MDKKQSHLAKLLTLLIEMRSKMTHSQRRPDAGL
jgi:hypothetical protein